MHGDLTHSIQCEKCEIDIETYHTCAESQYLNTWPLYSWFYDICMSEKTHFIHVKQNIHWAIVNYMKLMYCGILIGMNILYLIPICLQLCSKTFLYYARLQNGSIMICPVGIVPSIVSFVVWHPLGKTKRSSVGGFIIHRRVCAGTLHIVYNAKNVVCKISEHRNATHIINHLDTWSLNQGFDYTYQCENTVHPCETKYTLS